MADSIFKKDGYGAYARAAETMSTQSETDFEWSVKLIGNLYFNVGIASNLKKSDSDIWEYDKNAIVYVSKYNSSIIQVGSKQIHQNLPEQKTGDVIQFRFEPQRKKLVIDLVRIKYFFVNSLCS